MRRFIVVVSVFLECAWSVHAQDPTGPSAEKLRDAVGRSLKVIQQSQVVWYRKDQTCVSCHHQTLPLLLHADVHRREIPVDHAYARTIATQSLEFMKDLALNVQGYFYIDEFDDAWRLMIASAAGVKPNASTSAIAQFLASSQREDGGWRTMDARPPQSYSRFTITALSVHAIERYFPPQRAKERDEVLKRAQRWLLKTAPAGTEERSFQLLGLIWSRAKEADWATVRKQLLADQHSDGGWSQLEKRNRDAYSTGLALYALSQSGLPVNDPAYRRGMSSLLKTQHPDGSWRVESRLQTIVNPSPEYINAEFPHGRRHQYISIMGTAWAARALAQALPESKPTAGAFGIPEPTPADTSGWITAALNGSVDDLTAALKDGLSPDAKTAGGTTILMLAARHPKLVNLIIERGANVHARADSGLTALHVASRYRGNADVVRALLSKGATVNAPAGVSVTNDASPLFFAAANGDTEIAKLLIQAGAAVDAEMNVLGMMKQTPLETAVQRGDTDMVRTLLAHHANPNRASQDGATPLHRAVIGNHADIIALLVSKGARINQADVNGMTALHYAACVDGGSDQVIKALLAAGADPLLKDKEGKTARDMAQECRHQVLVDALSR